MKTFLEFEKPIAEIEGKIEELRHITDAGELNIADEVSRLQTKVDKLLRDTYRGLTPAQKVQVARHPNRPHALDYIQALITEFQPLAGDRAFAEDRAIIGGLGSYPVTAAAAIVVGIVEAMSSFYASDYKEVIVFTLIIPVLFVRSLSAPAVEEEKD